MGPILDIVPYATIIVVQFLSRNFGNDGVEINTTSWNIPLHMVSEGTQSFLDNPLIKVLGVFLFIIALIIFQNSPFFMALGSVIIVVVFIYVIIVLKRGWEPE